MKKVKKTLSILLAVLMVALMACPAFAEEGNETSAAKKVTLIFHLEGPVFHDTDNGLELTDKTWCGKMGSIYGNPYAIYDYKTNEPILQGEDSADKPTDFVVVYNFKPYNPDSEDPVMDIPLPTALPGAGAINAEFYAWVPKWKLDGVETKSGPLDKYTFKVYESELNQRFEFIAEYIYRDVDTVNLIPTASFFDAIANFFRGIIERIELFFTLFFAKLFGVFR